MIQYVEFKGKQTPILFGNAAFYQYEKKHGQSGFKAFMDATPKTENGEIDISTVKIAFYVDIAFCAFIAGGNVTNNPFADKVDDVAMWMDNENMMKVLDLLTESLPRDKSEKQDTQEVVSESGE